MRLEDIGSEFQGAALGDSRRNKRLERIALELARKPGLSFPEAMGSEGQLKGLYRFLNNDEVTFETVHAPHAERTRSRCLAHAQVLVLHDTTVLKFNIGYDIPVSEHVSIWPKAAVVFEHTHETNEGVQEALSTTEITLDLYVPVLFHPVRHFFVGAGPYLDTLLKSDTSGATTIGVKLSIGGWVGL